MVKKILFTTLFIISLSSVKGQIQTQIVGDSIRMHSNNATTELILESSTKNVNGFLYNRSNGRTEFRRGIVKLSDSTFLIGSDTLRLNAEAANAWSLYGNAGTSQGNQFLGTVDSNELIFKTVGQQRASIWKDGTINFNTNSTDEKPLFRLYPNGDFTFKARRYLSGNVFGPDNGVRYNSKYGILEVGTTNNFDTTISATCCGSIVKSAIVINSDFLNTFKGHLHGSIVGGDNMVLRDVVWSSVFGEKHNMSGNGLINKCMISGYGMNITESVRGSIIGGNSNQFKFPAESLIISGYVNSVEDSSGFSIINGLANKFGGNGQLISGAGHIAKTPYGTSLGNKSVDFSTLPYTGRLKSLDLLESLPNLDKYPLLSLGNSKYYFSGSGSLSKSNALTILYNGRTQINTTGFNYSLSEADVTPKAAFEVVSNTSGVLLPKLTTVQRDAILSSDLYIGLLLFNVDINSFQYYTSSGWNNLLSGNAQNIITSNLDFPNTVGGNSADLTISLSGASDGDVVSLGVPGASVNSNSCYTAWVSAPNTITVRFNNYGTGALDPAAGVFKIKVIK